SGESTRPGYRRLQTFFPPSINPRLNRARDQVGVCAYPVNVGCAVVNDLCVVLTVRVVDLSAREYRTHPLQRPFLPGNAPGPPFSISRHNSVLLVRSWTSPGRVGLPRQALGAHPGTTGPEPGFGSQSSAA